MSSSEFNYLNSLYELSMDFELVRIVDIANKTKISKASVYHALERLIKNGYAVKSLDMATYRITEAGRNKIEEYLGYVNIFESFLGGDLNVSKENRRADAINLACSLSAEAKSALVSYIKIK